METVVILVAIAVKSTGKLVNGDCRGSSSWSSEKYRETGEWRL
jgi:hypothetical protein